MSLQPTTRQQARSRPRLRWQHALLLAFLLSLLALGLKGWRLYTRAQALRQDAAALGQIAIQPNLTQLAELGPLFARAHSDALALRAEAAPLLPLADRLGWLPGYGASLAATRDLLDIAVDLTAAAEAGQGVLMSLLAPPPDGQPAGMVLVQRLVATRPQIEASDRALAQAEAAWARLPLERLAPPLRDPLTQLAPLLPSARDAIDLALALPDLLGAQGRREYLLIAQNPDELRPTGGLITAAGVLAFEGGRLVEFSMGDSGALNNFAAGEYPSAPEPLRRYMGLDLWAFQDANWSPDLPTAAQTISDLYRRGQGRAIAEIIAIDPQALRLLIEALGPLEIAGVGTPVTAANLIEYLRNGAILSQAGQANAQPWWVRRKDTLAPLGRALIARIEQGTINWPGLLGALRRALDERHLQLVVRQRQAAAVLARRGWDGAVQPGDADFMMLVDANLGYNKVTPLVQTVITYTADLSDINAPLGELAVRQANRAATPEACDQTSGYNAIVAVQRYEQLMAGCAWSYLRVLAPGASQLITALGNPTPGEWLLRGQPDDGAPVAVPGAGGASEIGMLVVIPPGETRRSVLRYQLPASVVQQGEVGWRYRLRLQRQPGAQPVRVMLRVRLPRDAVLRATSLPAAAQTGQELTFALVLDRDRLVEVVFQAP